MTDLDLSCIEKVCNGHGDRYCITHKAYVWDYCSDRTHLHWNVEPLGSSEKSHERLRLCKKRIRAIEEHRVVHFQDEMDSLQQRYDRLHYQIKNLNLPFDNPCVLKIELEAKKLLTDIETSESYVLYTKLVIKRNELLEDFGEEGNLRLIDLKVQQQVKYKIDVVREETERQTRNSLKAEYLSIESKTKNKIDKMEETHKEYKSKLENLQIQASNDDKNLRDQLKKSIDKAQDLQNKIDNNKLKKQKKNEIHKAEISQLVEQQEAQLEKLSHSYEEKLFQLQTSADDISKEKKNQDSIIEELIQEKVMLESKIQQYNEIIRQEVISAEALAILTNDVGMKEIQEDSQVELACSKEKHLMFMKKLFGKRLAQIQALTLNLKIAKWEIASQFMSNSLPSRFDKFCISGYDSSMQMLDISNYLPSLLSSAANVKNLMHFERLQINSEQINSIIEKFNHVETIVFHHCNLEVERLDWSTIQIWKLTTISFQYSGNRHENSWSTKPDSFEKIITAIKESKLKDSLLKLSIFDCGISKTSAEHLMNKHSLSDIKISEHRIS